MKLNRDCICPKPFFITFFFILTGCTFFLPSTRALELHRVTPEKAAVRMSEWRVLDARPLKAWQRQHLSGSQSFSWETYTRIDGSGVPYRILPPEQLASILGGLGISETDPVLVYGDADSSWGGEGWIVWMLAWLGHQGPVYFLDGGIGAWQKAGKSLTSDASAHRAEARYQARVNPDFFWTADQVAARRHDVTLIDTRGFLTEWLPGHLPTAVHIPWEKFYEGKNRTALSSEKLKALLKKNGVDLTKPVVYYCTGGIRSGYAWLVHELSGLPSAVNFEGGTAEWKKQRALVR